MDTRGFTLIELMVVIGLISLLAVLVAIPLLDTVATYSLRNATQQVSSDIRTAAQRAMTEHNNFYLQFYTAGNYYEIVDDSDNSGTFTMGDTRTLKYPPRAVTISAVNLSSDPLSFRPNGTVSASGTITLANTKGASNVVRVSSGGMISIQ